MSKNENAKLRFLERLDAMSKGEDTKATRVLRDYELDLPNGGQSYPYDKTWIDF